MCIFNILIRINPIAYQLPSVRSALGPRTVRYCGGGSFDECADGSLRLTPGRGCPTTYFLEIKRIVI